MWHSNWLWSIPLIVSTVIIHVVGLGLFNVKMVQVLTAVKDRPHFTGAFALVIGFTAIWATVLHAIEAGIWAAAYLLRTLPGSSGNRSSALCSAYSTSVFRAGSASAPYWRNIWSSRRISADRAVTSPRAV